MRNLNDYKKLIDGYSFSLSLLKACDIKIYDKIIKAKDVLNRYKPGNFAELVRNLRVDFINENDDKGADDPKVLTVDHGFYKEVFAFSYSPENEYILAMLYEKRTPIGTKKLFCEIIPRTLEDVKKYDICDVFRISTLDGEDKVKKVYNFIAGIAEDCLMVLKQDVDKPLAIHAGLDIPLEEVDGLMEDWANEF